MREHLLRLTALAIAIGAGAPALQGGIVTNNWSGVLGDRANLSGFAIKASGGLYPANVTGAPPTDPFWLNSITLQRPIGTDAAPDSVTPNFGAGNTGLLTDANTPVYIDIYTGSSASRTYTGYVGSSSTSVTWASVANPGDEYTFVFDNGIYLDPDLKYWFVFSEDNVDGDVANFRMLVNTAGADNVAGEGDGYILSDLNQVHGPTGTAVNLDWGSDHKLEYNIPEPASIVLLGLGALAAFGRCRTRPRKGFC